MRDFVRHMFLSCGVRAPHGACKIATRDFDLVLPCGTSITLGRLRGVSANDNHLCMNSTHVGPEKY